MGRLLVACLGGPMRRRRSRGGRGGVTTHLRPWRRRAWPRLRRRLLRLAPALPIAPRPAVMSPLPITAAWQLSDKYVFTMPEGMLLPGRGFVRGDGAGGDMTYEKLDLMLWDGYEAHNGLSIMALRGDYHRCMPKLRLHIPPKQAWAATLQKLIHLVRHEKMQQWRSRRDGCALPAG